MSRKGYRVLGWVMIATAIVLYVVVAVVRKMTGLGVVSGLGNLLNVALLSGGIGLLIISRNDKKFKEYKRNEDERLAAIRGKSAFITLFTVLISYAAAVTVILNMVKLDTWVIVLLMIPLAVGLIAEIASTVYFDKKM